MPPDGRAVVLIVEDHPDTRALYETLLASQAVQCISAGNAEEALQQAKVEKVDLVVLDLGLPRLEDGLTLARRLQELEHCPPLIALTGHRKDHLPKGVFRGYLMKPFEPEALVGVVTRVLGGS